MGGAPRMENAQEHLMAIGKPGAINAALLATADPSMAHKLKDDRDENRRKILAEKLD